MGITHSTETTSTESLAMSAMVKKMREKKDSISPEVVIKRLKQEFPEFGLKNINDFLFKAISNNKLAQIARLFVVGADVKACLIRHGFYRSTRRIRRGKCQGLAF